MRSTVHMVAALLVAIGTSMPVRAQAQAQAQTPSTAQAPVLPPAASTQEAAALAQGWVLLAEGKFEEASRTARSLSARFPRSVSAFALLIDSEIAVGGAMTALGTYESWLGARTHEETCAALGFSTHPIPGLLVPQEAHWQDESDLKTGKSTGSIRRR